MSLYLVTTFTVNSFSSSDFQPTYMNHCASIVPRSTTKKSKFYIFPHGSFQTGYYIGGDTIVGGGSLHSHLKYLSLRIMGAYETDVSGLLKIEATLTLRSASIYHVGDFRSASRSNYYRCRGSSARFGLDVFWSESSGKLCMVRKVTDYSKQGNSRRRDVVLKLYDVANSRNTFTTLVTEA